MGLLSDPSLSTQNKLVDNLAKHVRKVCFGFYAAGVIWFICLAMPEFNHGTYLSENALSPGLVYPEIRIEANRLAVQLMEELQRERKSHKTTTPHAWIAAKFRQFGLETHTHNYTLRYPFGGGKEFHGKNIYGIIRAPRIGSTEGIVFSAPYRAPNSVHPDISASVPLLLAFADFARRKNYWAKDLIFLVTEQEQLGMQAWLEAYHDGDRIVDTKKAYLLPGNLAARSGSLQAAVNIEVQDMEVDYIDVKIEGLNGKLPNLDMFNLVQRIMAREGLSSGYKQTPSRKRRRMSYSTFEQNLRHILAMLTTQSSGVPNGSHGLFHRYRIDALTIAAMKRTTNSNTKGGSGSSNSNSALPLLKAIEGISRSLNNLLERFHQSFFFYVIVHNDRYISIGDYMPSLVALVACAFIKAYLTWSTLGKKNNMNNNSSTSTSNSTSTNNSSNHNSGNSSSTDEMESKSYDDGDGNDNYNNEIEGEQDRDRESEMAFPYGSVLIYLTAALLIGYLGNVLPLQQYFLEIPMSAAPLTATILIGLTFIGMIMPFIVVLPPGGLELLHIALLLIYGCAMIVIGLLNFALGFFIAVISVPLIILLNVQVDNNKNNNIKSNNDKDHDDGDNEEGNKKLHNINSNRVNNAIQSFCRFYTFLLNPLVVIYIIVFILTLQQFPELTMQQLLKRAVTASMDGVTFALSDSVIYGNWIYFTITTVFLPIWIICWTLALAKRRDRDYDIDSDYEDSSESSNIRGKLKTN